MIIGSELPDTKQGLMLYKKYAEKTIKINNAQNKKLEKIIALIEARLPLMEPKKEVIDG